MYQEKKNQPFTPTTQRKTVQNSGKLTHTKNTNQPLMAPSFMPVIQRKFTYNNSVVSKNISTELITQVKDYLQTRQTLGLVTESEVMDKLKEVASASRNFGKFTTIEELVEKIVGEVNKKEEEDSADTQTSGCFSFLNCFTKSRKASASVHPELYYEYPTLNTNTLRFTTKEAERAASLYFYSENEKGEGTDTRLRQQHETGAKILTRQNNIHLFLQIKPGQAKSDDGFNHLNEREKEGLIIQEKTKKISNIAIFIKESQSTILENSENPESFKINLLNVLKKKYGNNDDVLIGTAATEDASHIEVQKKWNSTSNNYTLGIHISGGDVNTNIKNIGLLHSTDNNEVSTTDVNDANIQKALERATDMEKTRNLDKAIEEDRLDEPVLAQT